jgi:adenosylcobyric acid synthase
MKSGYAMTANVLVVLGTSSSAGKSLLVTALCRIYAQRGVRVAPFKGQNMSNNAAVCPNGAEIGRAQAVQAAAAGIEPTADINPVLLKPEADSRSQVVLMGRPVRTESAQSYYQRKQQLWSSVTEALDRLRERYELVIVEGAGSPVELNLKDGDIVNLAVARYAQAPVLLVGDIDRGGIFAQLLGTLWLMEPEEQALVKGLVVNKFRGDPALFTDGIEILEERSGVAVLGVVPYLRDLGIPEEDAVALDEPRIGRGSGERAVIDIAVIKLPRISNFDDFDPLDAEAGVRVRYISRVEEMDNPDAVIIPGTKSTVADLTWMKEQGLTEAVRRLAGSGVPVVGICGGYQMMGRAIRDPQHIEAQVDEVTAIGLLPTVTTFAGQKATHQAEARIVANRGWLSSLVGQTVSGYEIHMGRTQGGEPWLEITQRSGAAVRVADGAMSDDGRLWGCYLHGLFGNRSFRHAWLATLGWQPPATELGLSASDYEVAFDRLADGVASVLDIEKLDTIIRNQL